MGLFDKVKTDISSFDWNNKIGKGSGDRTNLIIYHQIKLKINH